MLLVLMKKSFLFLLAGLSLVACNKNLGGDMPSVDAKVEKELSFSLVQSMTKGYVTGAEFFDTAIDQLHEVTPTTTDRTMKLSAYLHPQSGSEGNYFVDYTFAKGVDGKWHHTPAIYWPFESSLDFLAYSSGTPFDAKDVAWNDANASQSVVLNVLDDRTQDDIVFASVAGRASSLGADAVPMEFKHSQAWLEFQIKVADASMIDKLAITDIIIEDAYNAGELTIESGAGSPTASWSFRKETSRDIRFDDNYSFYGSMGTAPNYEVVNGVTDEISYLDMLLPEQSKTSFIIKYVLAGQPNELQYRYDLSSDNWLQGEKYVYEVTFTVNEITVAPTVKEYADGVVTDLTPTAVI